MVTIDDGDEVRSIVTPELRLRFTRLADRWTHAIDIRPGPWQTLAEAVEWTIAAEDPASVVSPTYQELHFQEDGADVLALLVGQSGPHHFSAAVRVTYRDTESLVDFDVADRCRSKIHSLECNYSVHKLPRYMHLCVFRKEGFRGGTARQGRPGLVWKTGSEDHDEVALRGSTDFDPATVVSVSPGGPYGGWRVRAVPRALLPIGTHRMRYSWSHMRVLKRSTVAEEIR